MVTSNLWEGTRFSGGRRAKRTEARALRAELSERSRLFKTATKPAEFSGPNRSTQSYDKIAHSTRIINNSLLMPSLT